MIELTLIISACLVILGYGWWASGPMTLIRRWVFRAVVVTLVFGMAVPPGVIDVLRRWVGLVIPAAEEVSTSATVAAAAHLVLFGAVSVLLFLWRRDLALRQVLVMLLVLPFMTEGMQWLVDGRYASWGDVGLNLLGVGVGWFVALLVRK